MQQLVEEKYGRKKALRESNQKALKLGADYVREHFSCPLPFHLETMNANSDKILIDGNTAAALGCLYAGATVAAWYPITPATSVMDAFRSADQVLLSGVQGITDLITTPGLINLDFADVRTIMA